MSSLQNVDCKLENVDCSYYPESDVGTYFSVSAIVGGATGVILGGSLADRLAGRLCRGLVLERLVHVISLQSSQSVCTPQ